jgi:hypothetical protein
VTVRVADKCSFPFNGPISTRTFRKPLMLPEVGLLSTAPLRKSAVVFIDLFAPAVANLFG